ncbi:hypothetical protein CCHR01_17068 [Colletotrichum chrysophilum]|uniref:Uncharacterized protein n=1 Tax=Colletotrichum chrysophilum TaxID=1836956 RepID=A0AAD9E790_9PEZI|nr:hypothetical protein CCHR01_17068 [Colletotrichum chrysophilum]
MYELRRISAGHSMTLVDLLHTKQKSYAAKREWVGTEPRIFSDQLRTYINAFCGILDSGGRQKPSSTAQKLSEREAEVHAGAVFQGQIPSKREAVGHVEAVGPV